MGRQQNRGAKTSTRIRRPRLIQALSKIEIGFFSTDKEKKKWWPGKLSKEKVDRRTERAGKAQHERTE